MLLNCTIGSYSPRVFNNFQIDLPIEGSTFTYFKKPDNLLALLKLMISYWEAELIKVNHHTHGISLPFDDTKLYNAVQKGIANMDLYDKS